ncbi:MAG: CRISPR system precrRNA processing endoribonuclease RAMP protein Cas6 [Pseudomonadota bacterium]|nr:CRISPR system precrRNA processing endoribonuclease RAMP protein Cas6 [Pseudomonadota bacterium]
MDDLNTRQPAESAFSAAPPVARFRLTFEALETIPFPSYAGSAWRGLLGHGLRRLACVTRQPTCEGCMLKYNCLYSTFFETPGAPEAASARYAALPHPFVLEPEIRAEREIPSGGALRLGITLIGAAAEQAPYLIHAMNLAGERGFGRAGGRFAVEALEREVLLGSETWDRVYEADTGEYQRLGTQPVSFPPPPAAVRVRLMTPLRIKRHGHFVGGNDFEAGDFLRHLCTRLAMLAELYGGDPRPFQWESLLHHAQTIRVSAPRLHWHEWTRFSSRQNTLMQMGGLLGSFLLEGPELETFWPALWLGQWVHVGKATSFGLGSYRLELDRSDS